MRCTFLLFATIITAGFIVFPGCSGQMFEKKPNRPAETSPAPGSPLPERAGQGAAAAGRQESVTRKAEKFAASYNKALQDKQDLNHAARGSDYNRSQELIRSYNRNMEISRKYYKLLQEIAKNQGTGDITLFFEKNSAQIPEDSFQYNRLIRYLDSLEKNNRNKKLVFVIMGSASSTGEENHNQILSRNRADAPVSIIDQYLVNVPHSYHKVYGTGESQSPKGKTENINKRYRYVRIMALYDDMERQKSGMGPDFSSAGDFPYQGRPKQYTNSEGMEFIWVNPGTFIMGSPESEIRRSDNEIPHAVTLTKGFYLQKTEVTQQQWLDVMGTQPSHFENCGMDCPVENVNYQQAQKFLQRLNQMENTTLYRLPTEAEWEYACRAGTRSAFCTGPMIREGDYSTNPYLGSVGWYYRNSQQAPHSTALKPANAWGFHDMHGNVWEWCSDWQKPYPFHAATDPQGAESGKAKIRRGGSWAHYPEYCRSAYRSWHDPEDSSPEIGFRAALSGLQRRVEPAQATEPSPAPEPAPRPKPAPKPDPEPIPMPEKAEVSQCILIQDIVFDLDSSRITPEMVPLLNRAVEILKSREGEIELRGHTCSLAPKEYNEKLAVKRAEAIKEFLVSKGIDAERISIQTFGEQLPKFTNMTEAGRALNRRVEIVVNQGTPKE